QGLLRQQRERRAQRSLYPRQFQGRLRAQAERPRRLLRGPQSGRHHLLRGGGDGRREPALLLPRRRPLVLRRSLLEVAMSVRPLGVAVAIVLAASTTDASDLTLGPRLEYKHVTRGHEFHLSGVAVAAGPDGRPLLAWAAQEGHANQLYLLQMGNGQMGNGADGAAPVRV